MLPQTFEIKASSNNIVPDIPVNAGINAVTSPVDSAAAATKVYSQWTTPASLTIEGLDADGNFQTEIFTTAGGDVTVGHYSSITSIVPSVSITGLLVEYSDGASSPTIPINWRQTPANIAMAGTLTEGGVPESDTVLFQYSLDDPNRDFPGNFINGTQWFDVAAAALTPAQTSHKAPVQALRVITGDGESNTNWLIRILQGDNPQ